MDAIETIEYKGLTIKIYHDDSPESPRAWDNLGTLVCIDREYDLGDSGARYSCRADLLARVSRTGALWIPIMLDRYSEYRPRLSLDVAEMVRQKLQLSTLPEDYTDDDVREFWPKEQCGLIFIESAKLIKEFGEDSPAIREQAIKGLESELETYNQYLAGEVYGYQVIRVETCDACERPEEVHLDSCWGFYGLDDCKAEALFAAKSELASSRKRVRKKQATNVSAKHA